MQGNFSISKVMEVDAQLIALIRFILAISALTVIFIDPSEPAPFAPLTYTCLVIYTLYSFALYVLIWRRALPENFIIHRLHWIDVGCYLVLISLSGGANSIFSFFFFFSILVSSFRLGFSAGLLVVMVSSTLFTIIGYLCTPSGPDFELNRFLLRPICLLVLGYLMALWVGRETISKRRLELLKDVNKLSNPRFGIDQTICLIIERLRSFYNADYCLMLSPPENSASGGGWIEANREKTSLHLKKEFTPAAIPLLELPGDYGILYKTKSGNALVNWLGKKGCYEVDAITGEQIHNSKIKTDALADILGVKYFITVPLFQRKILVNRLYLSSQQDIFDQSDPAFLLQVVDQILPVLENVQILDRLASDAAKQQRQRISRDIHDSIIQPYIGIKLGLEALEIKKENGEISKNDIEKLITMANSSIVSLRKYINKLRGENNEEEAPVLISAIKQQAAKFEEFYGIKVDVNAVEGFRLNDRLAAEVLQIVTEGLSNIRRHTNAQKAAINFRLEKEKLFLEIENDLQDKLRKEFVPKSIVGRVESLGGETLVENTENLTKIFIEIPL